MNHIYIIMRIAMYFSGRINGYENCYKKLLEFKNANDVVFFCSLNYDALNEYHKAFMQELGISDSQLHYEAVSCPDWIHSFSSYGRNVQREYMYSHFYNNHKCFQLIEEYEKEHNIQFDCIVKYRADIESDTVFEVKSVLDDNTVYVPSEYDHSGLNDQIAYGKRDVMRIYSSLINNIQQFCTNDDTPYHPETLVLKNMEYHSIRIERFPFEYTLNINRYVSHTKDILHSTDFIPISSFSQIGQDVNVLSMDSNEEESLWTLVPTQV